MRFSEAMGALVLEMEAYPFSDLLGGYHMDTLGKKGQDWNAEFHTPQPVCELIARMLAGDAPLPSDGPITLCEPACGSGAMILAYAASLPRKDVRRLRVTAIDINAQACDMTFINTTLWGIPATVLHGNTLSLEFWAQWRNVHALCPFLHHLIPPQAPDESSTTAAAALPVAVVTAAAVDQGQPPSPAVTAHVAAQLGQLGFDFGVAEAPAA